MNTFIILKRFIFKCLNKEKVYPPKNSNFLTTSTDITAWLDKYEIKNYKLIRNQHYGFVINVAGDVNLEAHGLTSIPVKFNIVKGNFACGYNGLTDLEFSPLFVGDSFFCQNNQLTGLEFCPSKVKSNYINLSNNPQLKEIQDITDFSKINKKYLETIEFHAKLNTELNQKLALKKQS